MEPRISELLAVAVAKAPMAVALDRPAVTVAKRPSVVLKEPLGFVGTGTVKPAWLPTKVFPKPVP